MSRAFPSLQLCKDWESSFFNTDYSVGLSVVSDCSIRSRIFHARAYIPFFRTLLNWLIAFYMYVPVPVSTPCFFIIVSFGCHV